MATVLETPRLILRPLTADDFEELGADEVVSLIHPDNVRSIAVAERIGHARLRDVTLRGVRCRLYGQRTPSQM